jgi:hypothetical protein
MAEILLSQKIAKPSSERRPPSRRDSWTGKFVRAEDALDNNDFDDEFERMFMILLD